MCKWYSTNTDLDPFTRTPSVLYSDVVVADADINHVDDVGGDLRADTDLTGLQTLLNKLLSGRKGRKHKQFTSHNDFLY